YLKELKNSSESVSKDDPSSELKFYEQAELASRSNVESSMKNSDSKPIDLIASEFSFQTTNANHQHNSHSRKDMVSVMLPAYKTQQELYNRLNETKEKNYSKSLISRASHTKPEKMIHRNILKDPFTAPQECQQVSLQASIAKNSLDEEVPMDSAHHRKFSCTISHLYENYQKFHNSHFSSVIKPLNRTYFNQLLNESKLTHVDTIQQCQYCFDLKHTSALSPERLAKCFLHHHFRINQRTAYWTKSS
ncbi:hypothetical protein M1146_04395, partial [Patescibacteria group bacterium]|nr:hypothetical protein [Patescibacteria group bacterium]